jgi:hypothetical protein
MYSSEKKLLARWELENREVVCSAAIKASTCPNIDSHSGLVLLRVSKVAHCTKWNKRAGCFDFSCLTACFSLLFHQEL